MCVPVCVRCSITIYCVYSICTDSMLCCLFIEQCSRSARECHYNIIDIKLKWKQNSNRTRFIWRIIISLFRKVGAVERIPSNPIHIYNTKHTCLECWNLMDLNSKYIHISHNSRTQSHTIQFWNVMLKYLLLLLFFSGCWSFYR